MNILKKFFATFCVLSVVFGSFWFYKNYNFPQYIETKNQVREQNNALANTNFIKIASLGHENSYANLLWIDLIQYIGGNISRGNYKNYSWQMIEKITEILPKFTTAYEWALWLAPIPQNSELTYSDEQKKDIEIPLKMAEKWISETCDTEKLAKIFDEKLTQELWKKEELKNACKSGMLPYLIAFYGGQLAWNQKLAENYYKVSGLSDDAPSASQVLAVISSADRNNPKEIAKNFFVMAIGGFDDSENLLCINFSAEMFKKLSEKNLSSTEITEIENYFKALKKPDNQKTLGTQSCFELSERGLKYTFLDFINSQWKKFSNISKIEELLPKIGLTKAPTTPSQESFSFYKNENTGLWEYYQP